MPPHSHPADEHVEVLQGTLLIGPCDKLDPKRTMPAQVGDTGTAPAGAPHFTIAKGVTRVRVNLTRPYTITYVHAYEVPRQPYFPIGY
jgi:quercetin dioxygenase-like cupin family protein